LRNRVERSALGIDRQRHDRAAAPGLAKLLEEQLMTPLVITEEGVRPKAVSRGQQWMQAIEGERA
jgi:hypothetical protein